MLPHPRPLHDIPPHDPSRLQNRAQPALYHLPPSHNIPHNSIHHHPYPIAPPPFDPRLARDPAHDLHHPTQNQTCVPALIPPGMDPSQVDIRTFYPYTPNEVKHRKRTTRAQLKVLEGVYKYDTKPNASLRKKLAAELDMTPRGVQVWFQNRRAKTKQQAKKAEAATSVNPSKLAAAGPAAAGASPSNPPIAPRVETDGDDDHNDLDEDALSPAPPSPQARSEETAPDEALAPDGNSNSNANEPDQLNSTPDSRRGSIAPPPLPSWATASPSPSSAPALGAHQQQQPPAHASPNFSGHVNAHVRLSTHPPSVTAYSNGHLAPPDLYAQRRTSLPVASLSPGRLGMVQKRGFDPMRRRLSSDMGGHGHRMQAHPYAHVAAIANANTAHGAYAEAVDGPHHPQMMRRPQLMPRMSAPYPPGAHPNQLHPAHAHSLPTVPSQAHRPSLPAPRTYDMSDMPAPPHTPMYHPGQGYDVLAPRHSIDGSALGLMHAHAQMSTGMQQQQQMDGMGDAYSMDMNVSPLDPRGYAISQRPIAPPVPGPLPSPNFSFGNPFAPSPSSSSASGTPPNGASPPLLSLPRRSSEGGVSDADTEESSAAPLSRFGSVASIGGGSEVSWTSAYSNSEGGHIEGAPEDGSICGSRRESCASGHFLELFSDLDVGSNGGTPAPQPMHEQHQQHLQHSSSTSHLSPANYPAHHMQSHSPDAQAPQDGDGGYPSPSSASTISAGSNHSHQQHTIPHDNSPNPHTAVGNGNGNRVGQGHARTNTSSELAFALQDAQAKDDIGPLQYPEYPSGNSDHNIAHEQGYQQYPQEQAHHAHPEYQKAQAQGHFPTVYEGYVYPPPGNENEAYAAGAIELSHMCVPASEGVHFMGGYMQYP